MDYQIIDEKILGKTVSSDGSFTQMKQMHIVCDTVSDIPEPEPAWSAGSRCDVLADGGSVFELSNSREWKSINFYNQGGGGGSGEPTLIEKSVTANGTYSANSDDADGYSEVTVNVPTGTEISDAVMYIKTDRGYFYNKLLIGGGVNRADFNTMKTVIVQNGITETQTAMCYGWSNLESAYLPSSVTTICNFTFQNCTSLKNVTIPSSVTTIEPSAFAGCINLGTILIPSSVTNIADNAFAGVVGKIIIDKAEGSISGAPWGAANATVVWTG